MSAGAGAIRAGRAYIDIFANDSAAMKSIDRLSKRLKVMGQSARDMGASFATAGAAIVGPLALAAQQFASFGSTLADMRARTGVSAQALSELKYAAEQTGATLSDVERGIRKMQQSVGDKSMSTDVADTIASLGVSLSSLKSMSPEEQFDTLAGAIAKIKDPTARASAAMTIFGKGGTALLPMIENMGELRAKARELGVTMSESSANAADKFGDSIDNATSSLRGAMNVVGETLSGPLGVLAERIAKVAKSFGEWAKENPLVFRTMLGVGAAIAVAGGALMAAGIAITYAGTALAGLSTVLALVGNGAALLAGLPSTLLAAAGAMQATTVAAGSLGMALATVAFQAALIAGTAVAGFKLGEWIGEVTGLSSALEDLFKWLWDVRELTNEDTKAKMIDGWREQLDEGIISAAEFEKRVKSINAVVKDGPGKSSPRTGQTSSGEKAGEAAETAEAAMEKTKKVRDFEQRQAEDLHRAKIGLIEDETLRALAEIEARKAKDLAGAKEIGASEAAITERAAVDVAAVMKSKAKKEADILRESLKSKAEIAQRFAEIQAQGIEDGTLREIEMIRIRYEAEIKEAQAATDQTASMIQDRVDQLRELQKSEIEGAKTEQRKQWDKSDADARREIADLELEAAYTGEELERRKLALARQRAIEDAKTNGESVALINRKFDLQEQIAGARNSAAVRTGTFSSRLSGMFGAPSGQKKIEDATQKTADNTKKLVDAFGSFVTIGA
jgi:TP901 family phage tail tape measure protein